MSSGRVVKNTAYLISAFVGQKLLAFVYFTIVARSVGVDGVGRYFLALSLTTMFSIFIDLGLSNVLVRETAKDTARTQSLLGNVLGMKLVLGAVTVVAVLVTSYFLNYHPQTRLMISIACIVMVLDSIHLVLYGAMRGFQNLRYEAIGVVSGQTITIVTGTVFLLMRLPIYFLVIALVCGSTWNVIWASYALKKKFGVIPQFRLDRPIIRFYWSVVLPFALAGIFSRTYSYIDSIMMSKLISESSVGIYGAAYKIAFAFQFLPMAFAAAIYPAMSEYYVKDRARLRRLYTSAMLYLMMVAMPLAMGLSALAKPVVLLAYGKEFVGSVAPLQVLMFSLVFAFLYWPAGSLLNACDRQARNTLCMGITMVSNVLLNIVLIPRFGPVGAAAAALVCNAVLWGTAMWFARGVVRPDMRKLGTAALKVTVAAAVMGAVLVALRDHVHVAVLVPVGALVYAAALVGVGGVTVMELRRMAEMFLRRGRGVSDLVP